MKIVTERGAARFSGSSVCALGHIMRERLTEERVQSVTVCRVSSFSPSGCGRCYQIMRERLGNVYGSPGEDHAGRRLFTVAVERVNSNALAHLTRVSNMQAVYDVLKRERRRLFLVLLSDHKGRGFYFVQSTVHFYREREKTYQNNTFFNVR